MKEKTKRLTMQKNDRIISFVLALTLVFPMLLGTLTLHASAADCTHDWSLLEINIDQEVYVCSLCLETKKQAHTWNTAEQSCKYVNDHYHQQSCTTCGQIRVIPHGTKGSTTMGNWEAGFFNLYYWCRGCNTNATDKNIAAQYHATSASGCSSHEYTVLSYTSEGHILECRKCGTTKAMEAHNWTGLDASTGASICSAGCRAIIQGEDAPEVDAEFPIEYYFTKKGPYTVSAQEFSDFTDPDGNFNHIKIWYPAEMTTSGKQYPTIVFCNGTGSAYGHDKDGNTMTDEVGYTALFEHFASWGFILVANNRNGSASSAATDISLNYLLSRNETEGDFFYNVVDMDRIGIAGHSQGGSAVMQNLSGYTTSNDVGTINYECTKYYKAAWAASPPGPTDFAWNYYPAEITCPTFMACAESDRLIIEITNFNEIESTRESMPANTPVITALRSGTGHGDMVSIGKGYMIAWFRWLLMGDCYAAQAFVGSAELFNKNTDWTSKANQNLDQISYHSYSNYVSDGNADCQNVGTKTSACDFLTFHGEEYTCEQRNTVAGDALGDHTWTDAICTAPKTCSTCSTTKGEALGHSYENGSCVRCGDVDVNYVPPHTGVDHKFTADGETWDVTKDCVIDLAGFDVTINVTNNPTVIVIDSKNLDVLSGAEAGKLTINGDCTINDVNLYDSFRYLKVDNMDNTYSFHPFNMSITRTGINVKTHTVSLEAKFIANNVVRELITDFGVKHIKNGTYHSAKPRYDFGEKNGTVACYDLTGSLDSDMLEETRAFCAYIKIGDVIIDGLQRVDVTPKYVLGKINEEYAAGRYTGETKALADQFYADHEYLRPYLPMLCPTTTVTFKADGVVVDVRTYPVDSQDVEVPEVPAKAGHTSEWEKFTLTPGAIEVNAVYTPEGA